MIDAPWRFAFASVTGTSHEGTNTPCQDTGECHLFRASSGEAVLVAVVSDGAGSAAQAQAGSRLACTFFTEAIEGLLAWGGEVRDITPEWVRLLLVRLQARIASEAATHDLTARAYACTLVAAVVGSNCAAFVQIGDGAIVIADESLAGAFECVFWPMKGEYANTTTFLTDPTSLESFQLSVVQRAIAELAVFTDGLEYLALQFHSRTPHGSFFQGIFQPLQATAVGFQPRLSQLLAAFLDSPRVNDRTDDDKTLVVASRRSPATPG